MLNIKQRAKGYTVCGSTEGLKSQRRGCINSVVLEAFPVSVILNHCPDTVSVMNDCGLIIFVHCIFLRRLLLWTDSIQLILA